MVANNKKIVLIFISIVAVLGILVLNYYNRSIYGNDEESIKKIIYNTKLINRDEEDIYIIDIIDIGDSRFAGFSTQYGRTGLVQFEANEKGNYVYTSAELTESNMGNFVVWAHNINSKIDITEYEVESHKVDSNESDKNIYIIVADGTNGYTAKLTVNSKYYFEGDIPTGHRTMLVFEMPKTLENAYSYKLELFDLNGNKVEY